MPGKLMEVVLAFLLNKSKILEALTSKLQEPERSVMKEAEKIKISDFPTPETYRS